MADCKEKLFDQFPPVSTEEWMEKSRQTLKVPTSTKNSYGEPMKGST